ncbi:MAG: TraX protein [Lachnospiraceae bacterium]|nr:TraX protein [Lachnospiraceae bacterium]
MEQKKFLSGRMLKWIAVMTMFIDHLGIVLSAGVSREIWTAMRIIGRLAFPIFCFLLVEGFYHTRDVKKYLIRLGIFALLSEIPFDLVVFRRFWHPDYQNVFFTLFIGLLLLYLYNRFLANTQPIYAIMTVVSMLCLAYVIHCDYGAEGVLMIYLFYFFRFRPMAMYISTALVIVFMGGLEIYALAALPLIFFYNGEKGGKTPKKRAGALVQKYFFYFFYPVHLSLLAFLDYILFG